MDALLTLCLLSGSRATQFIMVKKLTDDEINRYMEMLSKEYPVGVMCLNSFFLPLVMKYLDQIKDEAKLERIICKMASEKKSWSARLIILPFFDESIDHWCLLVLNTELRLMIYFDSLGDQKIASTTVLEACRLMNQVLLRVEEMMGKNYKNGWTATRGVFTSEQKDNSSCGYFCLWAAKMSSMMNKSAKWHPCFFIETSRMDGMIQVIKQELASGFIMYEF